MSRLETLYKYSKMVCILLLLIFDPHILFIILIHVDSCSYNSFILIALQNYMTRMQSILSISFSLTFKLFILGYLKQHS